MGNKLWGGRFVEKTDRAMEEFSSSFAVDRRLWKAELAATEAHVRVLARGGYLSRSEEAGLLRGLKSLRSGILSGAIPLEGDWEDVHSFVLAHLEKKAGAAARKVHAGRSRNDLVSLDMRLYLREEIVRLDSLLARLQSALTAKGEEYAGVVIPAYTHLQRAQPVLFAHHLLAYVEMLDRDRLRLRDLGRRLEVLPAGSAAAGGNTLDLDLKLMAGLLGFPKVSPNSLDAVSDRDFVLEFLSAAALAGLHFSRLAEELVLWSTSEFSFVELGEAFCTGSSFLPHKRNPDSAELVRAKAGRLLGNFTALFATVKGLPLSYNRDLQEDKRPLFDSVDTIGDSAAVLCGVIESLKVNLAVLKRLEDEDYGAAPDLAEYLVKKGMPFRDAHRLVGGMVVSLARSGCKLNEISIQELRKFSSEFDDGALKLLSARGSLRARAAFPGSHPGRVKANLRKWRRKLEAEGKKRGRG